MSEQKIKIQDFHIGFIYEELEMDSNRYLNQGKIWVTKRYGLKSPRLFKMNKLINDGVIRAKVDDENKIPKPLNVELSERNLFKNKNFKKAFLYAWIIFIAFIIIGKLIEYLNQ